jgi:hypothetical protein
MCSVLAKQTFISEQKAIPRPKTYIEWVKKIKINFYIALFLFSSNYEDYVMNISKVKKNIHDCKTNPT